MKQTKIIKQWTIEASAAYNIPYEDITDDQIISYLAQQKLKFISPVDWDKLEKDFKKDCLHPKREGYGERMDDFKLHPSNLFQWFKEKITVKDIL